MQDVIEVEKISIHCIIGICKEEREKSQPRDLTFKFFFDSKPAATKSDLALCPDYAKLSQDVRFILESGNFILLETAAEAVAAHLLHPLPGHVKPSAVEVHIEKLTA